MVDQQSQRTNKSQNNRAKATLQSIVILFLKSPAGCQKWSRGSPQTKEHTLDNPGTPQCHAPHGLTVPRHTQHAPVDQDKGNSDTRSDNSGIAHSVALPFSPESVPLPAAPQPDWR